MHPALSVILFTVASGAGFGMLALLGLGAALQPQPPFATAVIAEFAIAFALTVFGLLSSTFHLGRPERAWRAFSQWRSSWLSREGVLSVATFPAAVVLAAALLGFLPQGWIRWAGSATLVLALATLVATGMIYASLRAIPRWSNPWTVPGYVALGLMSGALLLHAFSACFDALSGAAAPSDVTGWLTLLLLLIGVAVKLGYWWSIDHASPRATIESATGLAGRGPVRQFEPPHTAGNYVMEEMGYRIARKHAKKLRRIAVILGFAVPVLLVLGSVLVPGAAGAAVLAVLAAPFMMLGLLVERWLFFAEARHVVTLYYGAAAV
jgi:sulfite dehydrogenase (quinone) subunit SoeC